MYKRLFIKVREGKKAKNIHISESDVRKLCLKGMSILLSQPMLLELEAPIKVCGKLIASYLGI